MGAINYYTSDYITLGVKPYEVDDYKNDPDFMEIIKEEYGVNTDNEEAVLNCIYEQIQLDYDTDYVNIVDELSNHYFYYFHVTVKPGYYEGFTINIENNFGICYDDYAEKLEAQKEITEIKQFLLNCAGYGLVACFPGWCTGYSDYKGTVKAIKEAIKEMREEATATPTYYKLKAAGELW